MTSTDLLSEIRVLVNKKERFATKSIGVDSLLLLLRMKEADLLPMITELQCNKEIILHAPQTKAHTNNSIRLNSITLS
jgi:hypothetical protein